MVYWDVLKNESGLKLAEFLKLKLSNVSTKQLKKNIDQGYCRVNDRIEKFGSAVVGYGDRISFEGLQEQKKGEGQVERVLFEDDFLLVYNKPAKTTVEALEKKLHQKLVHRLDRDTTGALILAKSEEIFDLLVMQFKKKTVDKVYWALVDGAPKSTTGVIDNHLGKIAAWQGQSLWGAVDSDKGLHARTEWSVLKKGSNCALMECKPITGRTHQIRVHLAGIGHPILGDIQYGTKFKCPYSPQRTLLHAYKLRFAHPKTQAILEITAPLPDDFNLAIQTLWKS